jgi:hypothetical protein
LASTNNRGLTLNGLLKLGPEQATVSYWGLCGLSLGFISLAGVLAVPRLSLRQRLAFTCNSLPAPKASWSSAGREIEYNTITELRRGQFPGQEFLFVTHPAGNSTIAASLLASQVGFEEVCKLLAARVHESLET